MTYHYPLRDSNTACGGFKYGDATSLNWRKVNCSACLDWVPEIKEDGMKETEFKLTIRGEISEQAELVIGMLPEWAAQFNKKNQDYTNSGGAVSENFGIMGQYMKLVDKVHKLRKPMWDDEMFRQTTGTNNVHKLNFEDAQEILDDIIGHALLAKLHLKDREG